MSNLFYWLWLADVFDAISGISLLIVIAYGTVLILCVSIFCMSWPDGTPLSEHIDSVLNTLNKHKRVYKISLLPLLLSIIFMVALPSKTTIYVSLGASVTADLTENPTTQKALKLLNTKLDDLLGKEEKK